MEEAPRKQSYIVRYTENGHGGNFYFWNYCVDSFGTRHCTNCEDHCQTDAQDPPSTGCSFWVLAHLQGLKNTIV